MSEEKTRLGRDVYIALAAVGWADGKLDPDEADAIVRAALEEGLEIEDIAEIEEATKKPVNIGIVDQKLSKEDRLYVFGIAAWIAKMDGVVTDDESSALGRLAGALKNPQRPPQIVMKIVQDIASLSGDNRPARYDLVELRRVIGERLKAAQAKRAEAEG
jgi:tellurite resistance protein